MCPGCSDRDSAPTGSIKGMLTPCSTHPCRAGVAMMLRNSSAVGVLGEELKEVPP